MKISIQSIPIILLICISSAFVQAQDCISMYFVSNDTNGELVVQLKVDNFEDILISQFAFTYSYTNLALIDIQGNSDIGLTESLIFSEVPGYVSVSWGNASIGQTIPDGGNLIEMRFDILNTASSEFAIDPNFNIEFFDSFFEEICIESTPLTVLEDRTQLTGKLFHDLNNNCIADPSDLALSGWTVLVDNGVDQIYRVTDKFGYYNFPVDIGSYTVEVIPKNDLWSTCDGPVLETVTAGGELRENSFVLFPNSPSSALEVAVSSSEVRRCFDNVYSVRYKNNGTAVAQSATIEIQLGENLKYVSNNTGGFSQDGNVLSFELGNVRPGDGGDFQVVLNVDCENTQRGQTVCVEANITSTDIVIPPINWGGAVLTTKATCEGDSVAFSIQNIGSEAMTSALQSIVVEDDVMRGFNEVELGPQEQTNFKYAAGGGVYRVLVAQESGYPLGNFSTDFIEFCNGGDAETFQFVSMFQNEDESPYRDIQCQEVMDDLQTNNMSAFPVGYREDHLINQNEDIEYTVYFQNTGLDTVYNLYIENIIDESLNIETLLPGSSSHNYTITIRENRKLVIDFRNIALTSRDVDELASIGFVKFRITQNKDVEIGTKIFSSSIIYFDQQGGLETNEVFHTIGEEFLEIVLADVEILLDGEVMIAPNPASTSMKIELPESYENISYVLYDTKGCVINAANVDLNAFYIYRGFIPSGMYFLEIRSSNKVLGTKKIVFQD